MTIRRAIGLMSGTSMDGIDVALIETDGDAIVRPGPSATFPYDAKDTALLRQALRDAVGMRERTARPGVLAEAERRVTTLHAEAVEAFVSANAIDSAGVDAIGFHGQTVLHRPEDRLTVQLGDGQALADRLGLPVVYDLRAADVAAGGQGAPLVPVFHAALTAGLARPRPVAVLNIGGVANLTFVGEDGEISACDVGPGNALIDDFMRVRTGVACDRDGRAAAAGQPDRAVIAAAMGSPFFAMPSPKSLDRNHFRVDVDALSTKDGAATLTALTVEAVAAAIAHLLAAPRTWIVAGGGAHNPTLMDMLAARLAPASVETAQAVGWSIDALEAQAFAYLAVRTLDGLPISFPATTGAPRPLPGGVLALPAGAAQQVRARGSS